jgi:hypothetical protein
VAIVPLLVAGAISPESGMSLANGLPFGYSLRMNDVVSLDHYIAFDDIGEHYSIAADTLVIREVLQRKVRNE